MRIGSLIELFQDTDVEGKFAELRSMGMESCQLVCWDQELMNENTADKVHAAAIRHKVDITAFWCGWEGPKVWDFYDGQLTLGLVPEAFRFERMKMLEKGIDFAAMIHVRDVATHVGYMPENPYDPHYQGVLTCLKALVKQCKKNQQNFLFETGQETPVTLKRAIQDIEKDTGKGNVGINLDPANLIMYGKANPVDALEVFGEYVMGIHGKDGKYPTDGHMLGEEVPLGEGKVNYPAFVAKLKEIGYAGDITIEREISGEEQKKDILKAKNLLEQLIKEE
ncbi:Sugar phosphate isomerase/epimerase [Lacrimispora sphenoides]|jgi:sugar phosphate isomerase/epimerase|uniref:sugar phosphate isomerase/epimerase family protein n=1 Tax=Lacrimispora sphenoides TaxID=29370 RepID=UPI0008B1EEF2|nr:sugar phosphate isomerase/epimerase family protein [Lacrimispora sphenoides]SET66294.1 Sugar phosphate isomerase/epimerase [Lacrimispora sphenoides]